MPKISCDLQELKDLYLIDKLTLKQIGEKFGVSKQAIYHRLWHGGVTIRRRGLPRIQINRDALVSLYVERKMSVAEVATELGCSGESVFRLLVKYGIARLGHDRRFKYPELKELKIGESLEYPRPDIGRKIYSDFYVRAKKAGIKVSIKTIDDKTVKVTRIA